MRKCMRVSAHVTRLDWLQDTAHAAASVHATVMSEEDVLSEGETNLSSMRGAAHRSAQASDRQPGMQASMLRSLHQSAGQACLLGGAVQRSDSFMST
jgi:hypothetical protein